jgi:hypothetical protein
MFRAHRGLKWSLRQILPPRYILAVLPSSSGSAISGAVVGYITGIYKSTVIGASVVLPTHVKLHIELVFEQVVDEPAFTEPFGALFVRLEAEPIVVSFFVVLNVL